MTTPSATIARALVSELIAAGVREVVLAPGSRSAPLAYAFAAAEAAGQVRLSVRVDERGAGFLALGLARAAAVVEGGLRPVAVLTTSGTAVVNLHPAVLEASHSGLPLIVITADRPHHLRDTGASQTTRQAGVFGSAVRTDAEIPAGSPPGSVRGLVTRLAAAATGVLTNDPGPVHVNVAFVEPLAPDDVWAPPTPAQPVRVVGAGRSVLALGQGPRTLVVAGDGAGPDIARIAHHAGWPLLAEPTSGARWGGAITNYRDLLEAGLGDRADRIVVAGHPTLSRPVARLLARADAEIVVVSRTARWTDVAGAASAVVGAITVAEGGAAEADWLELWRTADRGLGGAVALGPVERVVTAAWDAPEALVLGSSNAVRAADIAAPGDGGQRLAVANRGLAGIDGTIATAAGLALGLGEPVRAVMGDLTFLHDATSLVRGALERDVNLQVVVIDDAGGAIFETLEYGELAIGEAGRALFERLFGTPQVLDAAALGAALGSDVVTVGADEVASVFARGISGRSVVVVPVGRSGLRAAAAARLEAARAVVGELWA